MSTTTTTSMSRRGRRPRRSLGAMWRCLVAEVTAEVRSSLRVPEFMVGAVTVPILLYLMFGTTSVGSVLPGGTPVPTMMFASIGAYGIVSLAIFTFGVDVAQERGKGWLRTRRVTPLPLWSHLAGKVAMGVVFAVVILAGLTACAIVLGDVRLPLSTWLRLWGVLLSGAVAFSTLGFALAWLTRPRAAAAIGNLVFLPLSFASGFFFPLGELPPFLARIAPGIPTHHYGLLAWAQVASPDDVRGWVGTEAVASTWTSVAIVAACFLGFGVMAVVGYRRERSMALG